MAELRNFYPCCISHMHPYRGSLAGPSSCRVHVINSNILLSSFANPTRVGDPVIGAAGVIEGSGVELYISANEAGLYAKVVATTLIDIDMSLIATSYQRSVELMKKFLFPTNI